MSYQVLARKWRPKNFQELMGQEHVVNVLANALSQNRLHHAYLFTGTRGVGKTTIARIFAKSLNCETGVTNTPCGKCNACLDIDQGCFVDLLEIDAASKTKVDDTRELLDNVQYAPSRGRYKVYLIDEVHMLSRHSFNALLKTLEEPPEHVKFILATTDPQKLPVTVLSRCLQFHLKALTVKQIEQKLIEILVQENVNHEIGCLTLLAKAARGSMRDSLSLTDQAIAQGHGNISLDNIQQMLGGIDQKWSYQIVIALLKQDNKALMDLSLEIASYAPSYSQLLAELIQLFHQVALLQLVEQPFDLPVDLQNLLKKFSLSMTPEDVQLFYQICLNGRKDMPYAVDEQAAFDMTLLRLFAFKPMNKSDVQHHDNARTNQVNDFNFDEVITEDKALNAINNADESTSLNLINATEVNTKHVDSSAEVEKTVIENEQSNDLNTHTLEVNKLEAKSSEINNADINSVAVINSDNNNSGINSSVDNGLSNQPTDSFNHNSANANKTHADAVPASSASQQLENELAQQAQSIEAQAAQMQHTTTETFVNHSTVNQPVSVEAEPSLPAEQNIQNNEPVSPLQVNSPVSSVLATRNMLRSRKKTLESEAKKSNDATMRQATQPLNNEQSNSVNTTTVEKELSIPEPDIPFHQDHIDPSIITKANQVDKWAHMIDSMQLTARIRQLAIHATISENSTDDNLILLLNQSTRHLKTDVAHQQLQQTLCDFLSRQITVTLEVVEETVADPYQIQSQINDKRLDYAKNLLKDDAMVRALQDNFQAVLDEESISPR